MAEPNTGLLAQLGGLGLVLGWFWTLINGSRKEARQIKEAIDRDMKEVNEKLDIHEKRVLKDYPTYDQMHSALDRTVVPIHSKLDENSEMLRKVLDKIDKDRDEEIQRLRRLANDRRDQ